MSNGEKVPPVDVENAILRDPLFEQVMLLGEGKAVSQLLSRCWTRTTGHALARENALPEDAQALSSKKVQDFVLQRIAAQLKPFPGYAQVRRVALTLEPLDDRERPAHADDEVEAHEVMEKFNAEIDRMYMGRAS